MSESKSIEGPGGVDGSVAIKEEISEEPSVPCPVSSFLNSCHVDFYHFNAPT